MLSSEKLGKKQRDKIRQTLITQLSDVDKIKLLLEYGTLAPSTHNTQPWKFEIKANTLRIFIDLSKKIPVADPTGRDMYISIGALIKNIEIAANEYLIKAEILISDRLGESDLVAEIQFSNLDKAKKPTKSQLLDGIIKRQNYRGFFKQGLNRKDFNKILSETISSKSIVKPEVADEKETIEELAQLTVSGLRAAYANPEFRQEIGSLINHNLSRKRHGLHGYSLRMNTPQSLVIPKVIKRKDIGAKLGALNYKSFILSPLVMTLATKDDNPKSWLETGQIMEEFMIRITAAGMTTSIYTAAIETPGLRYKVASVFGLSKNLHPQILFCVGTPGDELPYSVRKTLDKVLR